MDQVIPKIEDSLYTKLNSSTDIRALCHIECVGLGTLRAAGKVCPRHLLGPGRFDLIHFPVFFTIYTLDCHHIWRSLDPTLDSCSPFVKKSHLGTSFFLSCLFRSASGMPTSRSYPRHFFRFCEKKKKKSILPPFFFCCIFSI